MYRSLKNEQDFAGWGMGFHAERMARAKVWRDDSACWQAILHGKGLGGVWRLLHSRAPAFSSFVLGQHGERQPVEKTNPGEDRTGQKSLSSPVLELDRLGLES